MRALTLVLFAILLAACGGGETAPAPASEPAPTAEAVQPAGQGAGFSGTTLDGERVSLADFRGRPVLVNVWSSW